ncbi:N-acetyltransferase family protein [Mycolicibacterium sp.]|uniref:GNAT family N-acetyltransferase n=1 Tax=Mycolicibacterium sp. TaxID=2320850 RepID=UPI003D136FCF
MAVAQAHVRAWQVAYRGLIPQDYLDGLRAVERGGRYNFEAMVPSGPYTQVAVDGDTICGHVTTGHSRDGDRPGDGEIWALYVDPLRWGTGVGRFLIAAGCEQLRGQGHDAALLWVLSGNARARRFYELAGWHWDGTQRTDEAAGYRVDEVRYRRSLLS